MSSEYSHENYLYQKIICLITGILPMIQSFLVFNIPSFLSMPGITNSSVPLASVTLTCQV